MINDDGSNFNLTIWQLGTTAATLKYDWKTTTKGQLQLEISYTGQNNDLKDQTSIMVVLLVNNSVGQPLHSSPSFFMKGSLLLFSNTK